MLYESQSYRAQKQMSRVMLGQSISTKDLVENNPLVQTQGSSWDPRSCSKDQTLNSRNSEFNILRRSFGKGFAQSQMTGNDP